MCSSDLFAPSVFGCQAPDSGNAEILAHFGTDTQKARYLEPLLAGEISSTYSMTEPQAGSHPIYPPCGSLRDGHQSVIHGVHWFASSSRFATIPIIMVITDPAVRASRGSYTTPVPAGARCVASVRDVVNAEISLRVAALLGLDDTASANVTACLTNNYPEDDGEIPWHYDEVRAHGEAKLVCSVSLGGSRLFCLKRRRADGQPQRGAVGQVCVRCWNVNSDEAEPGATDGRLDVRQIRV